MRDRATVEIDWQEANQRHLTRELARIRELLRKAAGNPQEAPRSPKSATQGTSQTTALDRIAELFQLTPFESDLLLLCAGMELEGDFASLAAQAQKDESRSYPTFSLALATLEHPHWSAILTSRPLRRWRLIEIGAGGGLTTSPLRIDERVLHYLTGLDDRDERLAGLVDLTTQTVELPPSHQSVAENLAGAWSTGEAPPPALQLCGADSAGKRDIAAAASSHLGKPLWSISARALPSAAEELDLLMRIWERQALLSPCVLLLDCEDLEDNDTRLGNIVDRFIEGCASPLIVATRQRRRMRYRPMLTFEVGKPKPAEQREFWGKLLGSQARPLQKSIDGFVAQFNLSSSEIYAACLGGFGRVSAETPAKETAKQLGGHIWDTCRLQARPRLDDLAQRIEAGPEWDDLVLPEAQSRTLRDIAAQVRGRATVYERWGFARKSHRGLGISALFAGASGTGKTMAAEVLALALELDLYRIDLSSVISKYIGETEKNLRRVFDSAEEGGAVLLFDEADALFGKRSEVKDSHDRHANVEISYLLQRMEAYRGLAILTSNLKEALDTAFLRRIRFIVHFPFPNAAARAQIWRRVFPEETPTERLDFDKLAQLNVSGGTIRNIAMNAAFSAAHRGSPVGMKDLLRAARAEFDKLEKPLPGNEVEGWA